VIVDLGLIFRHKVRHSRLDEISADRVHITAVRLQKDLHVSPWTCPGRRCDVCSATMALID